MVEGPGACNTCAAWCMGSWAFFLIRCIRVKAQSGHGFFRWAGGKGQSGMKNALLGRSGLKKAGRLEFHLFGGIINPHDFPPSTGQGIGESITVIRLLRWRTFSVECHMKSDHIHQPHT